MSNKDLLIFANKLNNLQAFIEDSFKSIANLHTADMLADQQERIHVKGEDLNNSKFGKYSKETMEIKQHKGQFLDYIILQDTEAFKNSEFVKASKRFIEFGATDKKTKMLQKDYAPLFGLDLSGMNKYVKVFKYSILDKMNKYLFP